MPQPTIYPRFLFLFCLCTLLLIGCSSDDLVVPTDLPPATDVPPTAVPTVVLPTEEPTAVPVPTEIPVPTDVPTVEVTEVISEAISAEPAPVVDDGVDNVGTGRQFVIPGENVFPEGVSYNPTTGQFYVGATSDGTLYQGDVNGPDAMTVFSEAGADGRTAAVGTKVDADGNLWVAGGRTGSMFVYDTTDASLIAKFTTPEGEAFINDMAITESGVYFTDSFRPILWRVTDLESGEAEPWLDFTGTAIQYTPGFNLNGIVSVADDRYLIVVHLIEGELYRIDTLTKEVTHIDTGVVPLTGGDGLAVIDETVYVTRNSFSEIVPIILADNYTRGTGGIVITSFLFAYPTTIAHTGNTFLVANSQFDRQGGTPVLPFTVLQILAP